MSHNNHFFFARTLWGALQHADWEEAWKQGIFAVIGEFFRTLFGFNAWPFFVPAESGWRSNTIQPILDAHGIDSWGWGRQGDEVIFQVKLRQANWAQYLLRHNGVPLSGQLLDESQRSAYRPEARRSPRPKPGARPIDGKNVVPPVAPEAQPSILRDPVGQINRTVDQLAKW